MGDAKVAFVRPMKTLKRDAELELSKETADRYLECADAGKTATECQGYAKKEFSKWLGAEPIEDEARRAVGAVDPEKKASRTHFRCPWLAHSWRLTLGLVWGFVWKAGHGGEDVERNQEEHRGHCGGQSPWNENEARQAGHIRTTTLSCHNSCIVLMHAHMSMCGP